MRKHLNRDGQPFFRKPKATSAIARLKPGVERLVACALQRDGQTFSRAAKSHAEIRRFLGDENPYEEKPGDKPGYFTSKGRLVDREEAATVAVACGQAPPSLAGKALLSSDVDWNRT